MYTIYISVIIDDKILLINKGKHSDWWALPGGPISDLSNLNEEAKKTFFETTGYNAEIIGYYKKYQLSDLTIYNFAGKLNGGKIKDGADRENVLWIPLQQIEKLDETISIEADIVKQIILDCQKNKIKPLSDLSL